MNTTLYTPNTKPIDPIAPRIESVPQTTQGPDTRKILESIWADAAPIPVYDEAGQKRKERVAKLNAAGRGLSVLGDVLGLATGATIKQREPDRVTPGMLQSYQGYIQNYENRMDNFNYRNFRDRLAKNQLLLQDSYRQEDNERRDKALENQNAQYMNDLMYKMQKDQQTAAQKEQELELRRQAPYVNHSLMMEREQKKAELDLQKMMSKAVLDQQKGGFTLYDDIGNPVQTIDKGMMNRLVKTILQDPATNNLAKNDLEFFKGQFGDGLSTNAMNSIIGFYWDKSPMAKKLLGIEKPTPEYQRPPIWQIPAPSQGSQAQPEAQKPNAEKQVEKTEQTMGIDYSTLIF